MSAPVGTESALPFTGTGPGTLPLVVLGFASLVVGGIFALFGKKQPVRKNDSRWADLSARAAEV